MDKQTFVSTITPVLKKMGYKKKSTYWFKSVDNHICCVFVQGSQWDKSDYYVEVGFANPTDSCNTPTLLKWFCRHRCKGTNGSKNILPHEFIDNMNSIFDAVSSTSEINTFLKERNAQKIATQYWF